MVPSCPRGWTKSRPLYSRLARACGRLIPTLEPACLPDQGAEERMAPQAHREQRAEEHDGVHALTTLLRPIDILEIEPECELVERDRRRGAVDEGRRPGEHIVVSTPSGAHLHEPQVAAAQEAGDPKHQVVHVVAP